MALGSHASPDLALVSTLRLPRMILGACCGAMLGMAGATLQTLTRNGLADPGLLGVREGACVAILVVVLAAPTLPFAWRPILGMAGGLAAAIITFALAGNPARMRFILIGIGLSWFLSGIIALLLLSAQVTQMQAAMVWMAGSLSEASASALAMTVGCLALGGGVLLLQAKGLEALRLGTPLARGLGVAVPQTSLVTMAAAVLLTAGCVAVAGRLGFVGLIAPHLTRLSLGGSLRSLILGSALWGALLVVVADTIGRTAFAPLQIPAGIILAALGAPVLLWLLWRRRDQF